MQTNHIATCMHIQVSMVRLDLQTWSNYSHGNHFIIRSTPLNDQDSETLNCTSVRLMQANSLHFLSQLFFFFFTTSLHADYRVKRLVTFRSNGSIETLLSCHKEQSISLRLASLPLSCSLSFSLLIFFFLHHNHPRCLD